MKKQLILLIIILTCCCSKKNPVSSVELFSVQGIVSESNHSVNKSIENAIVKISNLSDTTDADGKYFIRDLKAGNYPIKITKSGYLTVDSTITISDDTILNFNLIMQCLIEGIILEKSKFTTMPIENAKIRIGNIEDKTNSKGEYSLTLQTRGNCNINISHQFYSDIDTTLYVYDNMEKDYIMDPILEDYYPLNVGNVWRYKFNNVSSHSGGGEGAGYKGTSTWKIIEKKDYNNSFVYTVLQEFEGIYVEFNYYDSVAEDTTYIIADTTYFQIEEDHENIVQIKTFPEPYQPYPFGPLFQQFQRYQPMRLPDTLIVDIGTRKYIVNIGLSEVYYPSPSDHNPYTWTLKLINFFGE
jgi:hypothetical protein